MLKDRIMWITFYMVLILSWPVEANWMYLGMAGVSVPTESHPNEVAKLNCRYLPGLTQSQQKVCETKPETINFVGAGARKAIYECQYQFRFERWNCTIQIGKANYLAKTLSKASKETAFIYAVTSAGVVHAVTEGCSSGNLSECSCDMSNYGNSNKDGWKWGGCSDNVVYGMRFARKFVDAPDKSIPRKIKHPRNFMNLHNNRAGRLAVKAMMRTQCRCHGVSGSCELKTCWRTMPPFSEIGKHLKKKYREAIQVRKLRRSKKSLRSGKVTKDALIHIQKSSNFCLQNATRGVLGTQGRQCNKTSFGPDGCDLLCCGRGYNTQVIHTMERCHCKFFWCCEVKCKTCYSTVDVHTCK